MLGNSCFNRARIAHSIYHWEYKVSRHIQVELKFREASNTSEQGKNIVESIYEDLKDSNFFETVSIHEIFIISNCLDLGGTMQFIETCKFFIRI